MASVSMHTRPFGPIEKISFPEGWRESIPDTGGMVTRTVINYLPPTENDVEISLYDRGLPVEPGALQSYLEFLRRNTEERRLTDEEIVALREIFGYAGDNQFTNKAPRGDSAYPAFNVTDARLQRLNGRMVTTLQGNFQDENGVPGKYFQGIFIGTAGDTKVYEVFYQGASAEKFRAHLQYFEAALQSITWKS